MCTLATSSRTHHNPRRFATASVCLSALIALFIGSAAARADMAIRCPAFVNNATIATQYACTGADKSPPLKWSGVPDGTKTLALIVEDPDAPGGTFIHWVAYDIPPSGAGLESGITPGETVPGGGKQGMNGFRKTGYNGPCPPPGSPHHYHFRLFALDEAVNPQTPVTASALEDAMKGHIKASAELVGIFQR